MHIIQHSGFRLTVALAVLASVFGISATAAEMTPLDIAGIDTARVQDGVDWSEYDGILVDPVTVEFDSRFKPVKPGSRLRYNQDELDDMKQRIADQFMEVFSASLTTGDKFAPASEPGPGTLRITPRLRDVYVFAPETPSIARDTEVEHVGHLTLEADIVDAASGNVVAHLEDEATGRDIKEFRTAPANYTEIELQRIFRDWGEVVRTRVIASN